MANKTTIDMDLSKELELLETELQENQKIFDQVKTHYDKIINSKSSATLKFITDQTSNLMNIRNNRITIIKEMINVKKINADLQVKEININKNAESDQSQNSEIAKEIYNLMKSDSREGSISSILNKDIEEVTVPVENAMTDEELLEQRMKSINERKEKENSPKTEELPPYIIATDLDKNLYAIDLEGNSIVEGAPIPDDYEIEFFTDELTGEITAKNQFGDEIPIVEVA